MTENLFKWDSSRWVNLEAATDQIATIGRHPCSIGDIGIANLFVCFKGYVSKDHVVEKDPQTPNGSLVAIILAELNPLRWGINPGACNENIRKMDLNEGGSCEYENSFSIYIQ